MLWKWIPRKQKAGDQTRLWDLDTDWDVNLASLGLNDQPSMNTVMKPLLAYLNYLGMEKNKAKHASVSALLHSTLAAITKKVQHTTAHPKWHAPDPSQFQQPPSPQKTETFPKKQTKSAPRAPNLPQTPVVETQQTPARQLPQLPDHNPRAAEGRNILVKPKNNAPIMHDQAQAKQKRVLELRAPEAWDFPDKDIDHWPRSCFWRWAPAIH